MTKHPKPFLFVLAALAVATLSIAAAPKPKAEDLKFNDVPAQTVEFIGYYKSIQLTSEQEAIKRAALTQLPAPCCSDNTAYTCCCPCNMAKSTWGLAAYLITQKGYDAERLKTKVAEWHKAINPAGFSGNVCATGGCGRSFAKNGCGGMGATVVQ